MAWGQLNAYIYKYSDVSLCVWAAVFQQTTSKQKTDSFFPIHYAYNIVINRLFLLRLLHTFRLSFSQYSKIKRWN